MKWRNHRAVWIWAVFGAVFGLAGPAVGLASAVGDGSDVPLSYLLTDPATMTIVSAACAANAVLFVVFGLVLERVMPRTVRHNVHQGLRRLLPAFRR